MQAKTGTGKTIAFLLPAIQNTLRNPPAKGLVSILVLSPTRELALQIAAEAQLLVSKLRPALEVHTAFGGTAKATILSKFKKGDPKILIATPGRLNEYLSEEDVIPKFKGIRTLVLDEADKMLDQGIHPLRLFTNHVTDLNRLSPCYSQDPQCPTSKAKRQLAGDVLLRHHPTKDAASLVARPQAGSYQGVDNRCLGATDTGQGTAVLSRCTQRQGHLHIDVSTVTRRNQDGRGRA